MSDEETALKFVCEETQWNPATPSAFILKRSEALAVLLYSVRLEETKYWRDWLRTQPISELPAAIEERIKLLEQASG